MKRVPGVTHDDPRVPAPRALRRVQHELPLVLLRRTRRRGADGIFRRRRRRGETSSLIDGVQKGPPRRTAGGRALLRLAAPALLPLPDLPVRARRADGDLLQRARLVRSPRGPHRFGGRPRRLTRGDRSACGAQPAPPLQQQTFDQFCRAALNHCADDGPARPLRRRGAGAPLLPRRDVVVAPGPRVAAPAARVTVLEVDLAQAQSQIGSLKQQLAAANAETKSARAAAGSLKQQLAAAHAAAAPRRPPRAAAAPPPPPPPPRRPVRRAGRRVRVAPR